MGTVRQLKCLNNVQNSNLVYTGQFISANISVVSILFDVLLWSFNGRNFVEESLGCRYVETTRVEFERSYEESCPSTPVFFILSPGVHPLKDVETLGMCYKKVFLVLL